jgi:ariadne-1
MVRSLQEEVGISWIEAQFLVECATKLLTARRVLKWSYAFAFYCDNSVYLDLFESVQAGLADAVEALSLLFEIEDPKKIVRKRLDFLNAGRLLVDRQKAMTMCTEDAITNGTLSKNATLRS